MASRAGVIGRNAWMLTKQTFAEWYADKSPRLGAALSYYTVFSLAPVLLVVIAVAALVLGAEAAQGKIVEELEGLLGRDGAEVVQSMLQNASERDAGVLATVIGLVTLLIGATGVMVELQAALNIVWKVLPKPGQPIKSLLRSRLLSLSLVHRDRLPAARVARDERGARGRQRLLVWVYYSSQIVLLGAEFTRSYANHFGSRVVPDAHAIEAPHGEVERLAAERMLQKKPESVAGADPDARH